MVTKTKSMVLRYCPVVKQNVVLEFNCESEILISKNGDAMSSCLNSHICLNDRGGCTNKIFSCK